MEMVQMKIFLVVVLLQPLVQAPVMILIAVGAEEHLNGSV
jgi:hypothetical protein